MNPYHSFVSSFARLVREGNSLPLGEVSTPGRPMPSSDAPVVMILSPHPDDECVIGGLALRLMREAGMRGVNVAVTLGSNRERQQPRLKELQRACASIGFALETIAPNGLERISSNTRVNDPQYWAEAVSIVASRLATYRPRVILFPHELDWNSTHIGTHYLVMDALATLPANFQTVLAETEYWGQIASPNLMVELSTNDVADLLAALSCHAGEVKRNAFHLRLPAWMQDNVRRGAELVGGQGGTAPDFTFATLYRVRVWKNRQRSEFFSGGKFAACGQNAAQVFGWSY